MAWSLLHGGKERSMSTERDGDAITEPVRVFVGASEAETLPLKVLEHTVSETSHRPVVFYPMMGLSCPVPRRRRDQPGTNFSLYRFMVPELAGFRGRAIYMDSDMLVFRDIGELWDRPFNGSKIMAVPDGAGGRVKPSVMVLDCGRLDWRIGEIVRDIDRGLFTYDELMYELCIVRPEEIRADLDPGWNSFDEYVPGTTALLHYTVMHTQPWISTRHRQLDLWMVALMRAVRAGRVSPDLVREQAEKGFVRPSLVYQVEHGIADIARVPPEILRKDRHFVAPYRRLTKNGFLDRLWRRARRVLAGLGRGAARRRKGRAGGNSLEAPL